MQNKIETREKEKKETQAKKKTCKTSKSVSERHTFCVWHGQGNHLKHIKTDI